MNPSVLLPDDISEIVRLALAEDIGKGDLTTRLISSSSHAKATVVCKEDAILCGSAWFDEVFRQLDSSIRIEWSVNDGDDLVPDQIVCKLHGLARALLTGERTALNFLQTLSGTATVTREYIRLIQGYKTKLLDTRKTIPGLRSAQKYAVACGGGQNHRMGLYDAILIKENHISATGNIKTAMTEAKKQDVPIEIEVENLSGLEQALVEGAGIILLDNFTLDDLRRAVKINKGRAKLEVSGNVTKENLLSIAGTGVDFISIGALTKHVRAIDFSMRFQQ
jgi:nicotinate-nucleotide pyrophosphorylase (carboxylating)